MSGSAILNNFIVVNCPFFSCFEYSTAVASICISNNPFFLNPRMLAFRLNRRIWFRICNRFLRNRFPANFHRYLTTQRLTASHFYGNYRHAFLLCNDFPVLAYGSNFLVAGCLFHFSSSLLLPARRVLHQPLFIAHTVISSSVSFLYRVALDNPSSFATVSLAFPLVPYFFSFRVIISFS